MNRNQKLKIAMISGSSIYTKRFKFKRIKYKIPKEVYSTCKIFFIMNLILLPLVTIISSYNVLEGNFDTIWIIVLIYMCYIITYVILYYLILPNNFEELVDKENMEKGN